ncbi:hypothetical protein NL676_027277 [Syzygium grande]|nr:hypothetical protein NL676_027277 [Syzygium grande]
MLDLTRTYVQKRLCGKLKEGCASHTATNSVDCARVTACVSWSARARASKKVSAEASGTAASAGSLADAVRWKAARTY